MKLRNKWLAIIISICMLLPMFGMSALAASGSLSVSGASGNVGSTVSVKCTIKSTSGAIGAATVLVTYDPASLKFVSATGGARDNSGSVIYAGEGDGSVKSLSFTIKFKILKEGSHKVSASSNDAYDWNMQRMEVKRTSAKVTGKVPSNNTSNHNSNNNNNNNNNHTPQDTRDKNNKLSSLQVYPGTLSPAFSSGTTPYTVTVPGDTTEVTISATPQSSKATVSVSGGKDLKLGANEAKVVVVAENGSSIAYKLTIMCGEVEKIPMDGVDHTIYEGFTDDQIPKGFSRTKVTYNNRQYEALAHVNGGMKLMCLKNKEGFDFYIYDENKQSFLDFAQIQLVNDKYVIPLPLQKEDENFTGYKTTSLTLQGKTFEAWKLNDEFSVVYVLNQDGANALYRYDSVDGTFQRHTDIDIQDAEPADAQLTWFPSEYYAYAIVGLLALVAILWITMVYFIASRKARHEGRKRKAMKRQEKKQRKEEKMLEKQRRKEEKMMSK